MLLILLVFLSPGITAVTLPNMTGDNFNAIALYNQAVDEANAGRFAEAVNLSGQALSIQPNFTLAQITHAGALMELGRMDEAKTILDTALNTHPENPSVMVSISSYYLNTGNAKEAFSFADKAITLDPSMVEAWILKGTASGELGDFQEELNASNQALLVEPGNQLAQTNKEYAIHMMKNQKTPINVVTPLMALGIFAILIISKRRE